jgi:hypothetical protein
MAERIDETAVIAWLDGELTPEEAARVEQAVAHDAGLRAVADRHRMIQARFAAAFGPIAHEPVELPRSAEVISLAAARAARAQHDKTPTRRWWIPGAIAASLVAGLVIGQMQRPSGVGVGDRADALALAPVLAHALDRQLAGEPGPVRVALSFRAQDGSYCRSFSATYLAGVACRAGNGWRMRYATPAAPTDSDYRMAGNDPAEANAIAGMIAGDPLDAAGERTARDKGWR